MNFEELCAEVLSIVKRPDLQQRVERAVTASILKAHQTDFYYRDLMEYPILFTQELILQQFIPSEIIPRFRKAKYLRLWHGGPDGRAGQFLTPIQVENSIDGYGYNKTNVFYMAGRKLQIRGAAPVVSILFGCYLSPKVTPSNEMESWIADEHPYVIVYDAVSTLFHSIGFSEQSQRFLLLYSEELGKLKMSNVDDTPV